MEILLQFYLFPYHRKRTLSNVSRCRSWENVYTQLNKYTLHTQATRHILFKWSHIALACPLNTKQIIIIIHFFHFARDTDSIIFQSYRMEWNRCISSEPITFFGYETNDALTDSNEKQNWIFPAFHPCHSSFFVKLSTQISRRACAIVLIDRPSSLSNCVNSFHSGTLECRNGVHFHLPHSSIGPHNFQSDFSVGGKEIAIILNLSLKRIKSLSICVNMSERNKILRRTKCHEQFPSVINVTAPLNFPIHRIVFTMNFLFSFCHFSRSVRFGASDDVYDCRSHLANRKWLGVVLRCLQVVVQQNIYIKVIVA